MERLALAIARWAAAAWVGAAILFVVTSVREVQVADFDSITKDRLALVRFPAYYVFGFTLVPLASIGALIGGRETRAGRVAIGVLAVAMVLMIVDYQAVYRPMRRMILHAESVRNEKFTRLHRVSEWLNFSDVALCGVASGLLCWPARRTG